MANLTLEELSSQIQQMNLVISDLRKRVSLLERTTDTEPTATAEPQAVIESPAVAGFTENPAPLFGWALLGLSGAYLLRSLSETGAIPVLAGAVAGLLYAASWLSLAARRAWDRPLASTVHSITAALVVTPLLWETAVRLKLIDSVTATAILIVFVFFGLAVAWRHSVNGIAWVVTVAGIVTSVAIFRELHDGRAWGVAVLLIAAGVEFSACRDHWLGLRWIAALTADVTILALTLLVTRPHSGPEAVVTLSPLFALGLQVGLLAMYLASTADRTLIRKLPITGFEIGQAAVAFLVSVGGALRLTDATNLSRPSVGVFCLVFSVLCYLISFALLDNTSERRRNFHTYSVFAVALMLGACGLLLSASGAAVAYATLAVLTACLATRTTLRLQSAVFLGAAILAAGALPEAAAYVTQSPRPATLPDIPYLATLAAALAYYLVGRPQSRVEAYLAATLVAWLSAGLAAAWVPAPAIRTGILAGLSLAGAVLAVRFARAELRWTAYTLLAFSGLKVILEDLWLGQSFAVFASLLQFGCALILVPRTLRSRIEAVHVANAWEGAARKAAAP
jgi:hypothetical protein